MHINTTMSKLPIQGARTQCKISETTHLQQKAESENMKKM